MTENINQIVETLADIATAVDKVGKRRLVSKRHEQSVDIIAYELYEIGKTMKEIRDIIKLGLTKQILVMRKE